MKYYKRPSRQAYGLLERWGSPARTDIDASLACAMLIKKRHYNHCHCGFVLLKASFSINSTFTLILVEVEQN